MSRIQIMVSIGILLPLLLITPASANLLINPGFETGDFTGWDGGGYDVRVLEENPHTDNYHARIGTPVSGSYGEFSQTVNNITPNEKYKLSTWAYVSNGDGRGVVQLEFYDNQSQYLDGWFQYLEELPRNEYNFIDSGWITAPSDSAYARVYTGAMSDFYVDFDDFNLQPIPEPSTLILLGVGLFGLLGFDRKKRVYISHRL